jgi:hypothetical protein
MTPNPYSFSIPLPPGYKITNKTTMEINKNISAQIAEFREKAYKKSPFEQQDSTAANPLGNMYWYWTPQECENFLRQALQAAEQRGREQEREEILAGLPSKELIERIKLEFRVVKCDCGEPYKESDVADYVDELLTALTEWESRIKARSTPPVASKTAPDSI